MINFIISSSNAKKWEVELSTLKNNNMRLTSALQESTANVDEWKRQLHSYKEENQRLKSKYIGLEAAKGNIKKILDLYLIFIFLHCSHTFESY